MVHTLKVRVFSPYVLNCGVWSGPYTLKEDLSIAYMYLWCTVIAIQ